MTNNIKGESQDATTFYCLKRLYRDYAAEFKRGIFLAIFCAVISALSTGLSAWMIKPVLDEIFISRNSQMLLLIPLAIVLNAFIKGAAYFYQTTLLKIIGYKIIAKIQLSLYRHLMLNVCVEYFTYNNSGNFISQFVHEINAIKKCMNETFVELIGEILGILILVMIMIYNSPQLSLIALFVFPAAFLLISYFGRHTKKLTKGIYYDLENFTKKLDESFVNIILIRSYCREKYEIAKASKLIQKILDVYKKSAFFESASSPLMEAIGFIAIAIIIWYGGNQVIQGVTTAGAFFSFIAALLMAYKPLKAISKLYNSIQEGVIACRKLFASLDDKSTIICSSSESDDSLEDDNDNVDFQKDIKFDSVSFAYKAPTYNEAECLAGRFSLDSISFTISKSEKIAIVGASGSGKSTIMHLLERFYDPISGKIKIDNIDIRNLPLNKLRRMVAIVTQNTVLFDNTIMENIRYGNLNASDKDVHEAASKADIESFILSLPEKYNTIIGANGASLSGGQRQKLAIARAIVRNAPILLLDEATSALDIESENNIRSVFESLIGNQTTIIITHKLNLAQTADRIIVMSHGKIIESGSHDDLLDKCGEYARLWAMQ